MCVYVCVWMCVYVCVDAARLRRQQIECSSPICLGSERKKPGKAVVAINRRSVNLPALTLSPVFPSLTCKHCHTFSSCSHACFHIPPLVCRGTIVFPSFLLCPILVRLAFILLVLLLLFFFLPFLLFFAFSIV